MIATRGFLITEVDLPFLVREKLLQRNWPELDQAIGREHFREA